jgi:hypothetical protein
MADKLPEVPKIVSQLAAAQEKKPLSWFVADDHVEIVFTDGQKMRFLPPFAVANKTPVAPEVMKIPARSHRK